MTAYLPNVAKYATVRAAQPISTMVDESSRIPTAQIQPAKGRNAGDAGPTKYAIILRPS
ncbi:hypothetical protein H8B02_06585 [Bradyrhizobium sp. Pear77]|uniref:hypothetical protein n=1 Tax=Bradyrhizobium altum TaxID=1571202 RepID=UPI001E516EB9|nr:hypothetical protein [Bradyrhizobium altum]MCC8953146.1 hypothetical protein [Bradyrhizobium altum]